MIYNSLLEIKNLSKSSRLTDYLYFPIRQNILTLTKPYTILYCLERAASPTSSSQPLHVSLHLARPEPHPVLRPQVREQVSLRHVLLGVVAGHLAPVQPDGPRRRPPAVPERGLDIERVVAIRHGRVHASRLGIGGPQTLQLEEARQRHVAEIEAAEREYGVYRGAGHDSRFGKPCGERVRWPVLELGARGNEDGMNSHEGFPHTIA